jgi:hypothetical protein
MEAVFPSEVLVPLIARENARRHTPEFIYLKEIRWKDVEWICLAQNTVQWRLVVRKTVKFRPHTNVTLAWLAKSVLVLNDKCLCS